MWATWQKLPVKAKTLMMLMVISTIVVAQSVAIFWVQQRLSEMRENKDKIREKEVLSMSIKHEITKKNLAAMDVMAANSRSQFTLQELKEFQADFEATKKAVLEILVPLTDFCQTNGCTEATSSIKANAEQLDTSIEHLFALAQQGRIPAQTLEELDKKIDGTSDASADLADTIYSKMQEVVKVQTKQIEDKKNLQFWITCFCLVALIWAVAFIYISLKGGVLKPIERVAKSLKTAVGALRKSTQGSGELSKKMSMASQNQEAAVTQSVAAMTEIENVVRRSEENLVQADKLAQNARSQGLRSSEALEKIESSVTHLLSLRVDLQDLERVMEEISFKTETINNIVFKTQVLSLNASIEASRAGAHGKGFSVVASEVGRLADLSGKAAEEISAILLNSRRKVQQVVEGIGAGIEKTNQVTLTSKEEIRALIAEVDSISQRVSDVRLGAQEQTHAIEQVVRGMADLSKDARAMASLATDSLTMTSELAFSVEEITQAFGQTQVMLYGQMAVVPSGRGDDTGHPYGGGGMGGGSSGTHLDMPYTPAESVSDTPTGGGGSLQSVASRIASKAKSGAPESPHQDKAS